MALRDIMENLKEKFADKPEEEIDDNETKDRYLRSLRRERRMQMEEVEKEDLKKKIAEFKKQRMRENMFGIKDSPEKMDGKVETLKALKKKKKIQILKQQGLILRQEKVKKLNGELGTTIMTRKTGMLEKGNL